jgi:hypothetical protein
LDLSKLIRISGANFVAFWDFVCKPLEWFQSANMQAKINQTRKGGCTKERYLVGQNIGPKALLAS